jgi:cyclopropane-fatty-acyl-phospholipid synthase
MTQFVRLLIVNQRIADKKPPSRCSLQSLIPILSAGATTLSYLRHKLLRKNTVAQARRNIHQHYDLGNKFFASWLDQSMVYSCAIYRSPNDTLYDAQMNKLEALTSKARLSDKDHLLEIGCGWGALSLYAAKKTGCRVTGITVSEQQLEYCRELARRECELDQSLKDRINFELVDYRVFAKQNPGTIIACISCQSD